MPAPLRTSRGVLLPKNFLERNETQKKEKKKDRRMTMKKKMEICFLGMSFNLALFLF
jgi:hypothetical protein